VRARVVVHTGGRKHNMQLARKSRRQTGKQLERSQGVPVPANWATELANWIWPVEYTFWINIGKERKREKMSRMRMGMSRKIDRNMSGKGKSICAKIKLLIGRNREEKMADNDEKGRKMLKMGQSKSAQIKWSIYQKWMGKSHYEHQAAN
jgi:hypothetical protein